MERHNRKCNLACGWQIKGECFKPANTECRGPSSPAKDIREAMLEATKSYMEKGPWDITDDIQFRESPVQLIEKEMDNGYKNYIVEQFIKLDIDPDVLMHQQLEINRLKKEIHWWKSQYEDAQNLLAWAKEDLEHRCSSCWYENTPSLTAPCCICLNYDKWKWRGDEDGQDT